MSLSRVIETEPSLTVGLLNRSKLNGNCDETLLN
jgi:hypothetical protein